MEQRVKQHRKLLKERYPERFAKMDEKELQMFREHEMRMMQLENKEFINPEHETFSPPKSNSDNSRVSENDSLALVALYIATNGPGWYNKTNWLTGPLNTWHGITVSDDFVTEIYLYDNNLIGSIPPEIGNLTNLQVFDLDSNQLTGSIPPEIGNLVNLQLLLLNDNQLNGSIPPEIGNLANIHGLSLNSNQLSGSILSEIGNLANLQWLLLNENQLNGSIPPEIGNLANLQLLLLNDNQLNGSIPPEIGNLTNLQVFNLYSNQLSGSIPVEIGNLSNLYELLIDNNQITGSVPQEIGNLANLQYLQLYNNQLSGSIPVEICNISNLIFLAFENNYFDLGSCPAIECLTSNGVYLSDGTQLNGLNLLIDCGSPLAVTPSNQDVSADAGTTAFNVFSTSSWTVESNKPWCTVTPDGTGNGTITANYTENTLGSRIAIITVTAVDLPSVYVTLTQAGIFNLSTDSLALVALYNATNGPNWTNNTNWLSGPVNTWYGIDVINGFVTNIYLPGNKLMGSMPSEIGNLTNLELLVVDNNQLTGGIPPEIGNLANLQRLDFSNNQLSGCIPDEIGNLTNLFDLGLHYNQLCGDIPTEIGNLVNLQWLIVYSNQFTGSIPVEICNIPPLDYFAFEDNYFDFGSCPAIDCLQSNGVTMNDGMQLNGLNLFTDCSSPLVVTPIKQDVTADAGTTTFNVFSNATWTAECNTYWCTITPEGESNGTITATYVENTSFQARIANIVITVVDLPPVVVTVNQAGIGNLSTDSLALVALYNSTNGTNWTNNSNWLVGPLNSWYGITVSGDNVTQVNLGGNNLIGIIPAEIGHLANIQHLGLHENQLSGSIPTEIGNLSNLHYLYLFSNELTGNIPSEIGHLANIQYLGLHENQLSGSIPTEIGNLSNLHYLYLFSNELTGNIPSEIGVLSNLYNLLLADNRLSGNIPPEIGNLSNLYYLNVSGNELTGNIPSEIGNLSNLYNLYLNSNELTGNISDEICNIPNLNDFYFWDNYLTSGSCPAIACLQSNGVNMYNGTQHNGLNLLTDCYSLPTIEIGIEEDWICADESSYYFGNVTAYYYDSIQWNTSGSGYFDDVNALHPTYFPSLIDYQQGSIDIFAQIWNYLGFAVDTMQLHFEYPPVISAGEDVTINAGNDYNLADANAANYSGLEWSTSGDGVFDDPGLINPVYIPGFSDIIAGQVELCMLATTQFCQVTNCMTLIIISSAAISVAPLALFQELAPDETVTQSLTISNTGEGELYWSIGVNDETAQNFSNIGNNSLNSKSKTANAANQFTAYCDASTTTGDEYIANVLFGTINNSSGWQGGVSDYTAISTTIEAGASEILTVINPVPYANDIVYVWVDWNKNYEFEDGEELTMLTNVGGTGALFTGSVAVPVGQASGDYRLRIRMTYSTAPTPCENAQYGEIEDYTIVVKENWITISPTTGIVPSGESVSVDVTFDATNLTPSVYGVSIYITSNDLNIPIIEIPVQLSVQTHVTQTIFLNGGWSGISSYLTPISSNVESIFQPILTDLIILQSETGFYWPGQNINTLGAWNTHEGYQIKVENTVELNISGTRENNKTLQLATGWNLIPVLSECEANVAALFAGKDVVIIKEVAGWNIYWPEFGINSLGALSPGKAYFVLMGSNGNIEFPACEGLKAGKLPGFQNLTASPDLSAFKISATPITHIIAIPAQFANVLNEGDIISVYDKNGNCFGLVIWQSHTTALTIFGNDPTTLIKDGFDEDEPLYFGLIRESKEYSLEVTLDASLPNPDKVFGANGLSAVAGIKLSETGISSDNSESQIQIIPNPAKDEFLLVLPHGDFENCHLEIFRIDGQFVRNIRVTNRETKVDISSFSRGVYILKIEMDDVVFTKRLVKN